ncbi:MAG: bacillithiol biosynthesis BshC, partial [Gemmatimonadota bacterium]|nr:bacillithiol biosynthesis BshC [Gemmatimonadota bacterium]
AYRADATVGGAYVALLRALLDPLGIPVLDASHPAVRRAGAGVLHAALERGAEVAAGLQARAGWLAARGFEPQVADVAGLSTVFVHEQGVKRRVPVVESAAVARAAAPEALSPNVLLRPVLERAILPTVAYLAGPGELAYFAQVSAVADALGAAAPLAVPRWSCTIVEPAVDRALTRLGVGVDEVKDADALAGRTARAAVPSRVQGALDDLRRAVREGIAALAGADGAAAGGPLLPEAVVTGAERQIGFRLDRLERRLLAAAKRRGSEALRDVALARAHLWPEGHAQERTLNFIPFLARYGDGLWTVMRRAAGEHARRLLHAGAAGDS